MPLHVFPTMCSSVKWPIALGIQTTCVPIHMFPTACSSVKWPISLGMQTLATTCSCYMLLREVVDLSGDTDHVLLPHALHHVLLVEAYATRAQLGFLFIQLPTCLLSITLFL